MLFSEPKISQRRTSRLAGAPERFQCSSASRKFLNSLTSTERACAQRFSALQRAENFSIQRAQLKPSRLRKFQCSSASRKFLNAVAVSHATRRCGFQCSSASRKFLNLEQRTITLPALDVSVLFSEPKISQQIAVRLPQTLRGFQCSSASRKFLNAHIHTHYIIQRKFQCSSASRKFLNPTLAPASIHIPDRDDHASSFLSLPGVSL